MSLHSCVNHDLTKQIICSPSTMVLAIDSLSEASSCGVADGKIFASIQGGTPPYMFQLNNSISHSVPVFTDLPSGIYSISVQDHRGCQASLSNVTVSARNFTLSTNVINDTDCLSGNGLITVTVNSGNPPFLYKLNNEMFSTLHTFSGLRAGLYSVTVKDAINCIIQLNITVARGVTATSWTRDILPIMKTYCALNGCHDGKSRFDYRQYQNAENDALDIKFRTQNKSMPFDGTSLTQSQIELIACWVDDGAIEN